MDVLWDLLIHQSLRAYCLTYLLMQPTPVSNQRPRRMPTCWAWTCPPLATRCSIPASLVSFSPGARSTVRAGRMDPGPGRCLFVEVRSPTPHQYRTQMCFTPQLCDLQLFCHFFCLVEAEADWWRFLCLMWEVMCEMHFLKPISNAVTRCCCDMHFSFSWLKNNWKSHNACSRNSESQSQRWVWLCCAKYYMYDLKRIIITACTCLFPLLCLKVCVNGTVHSKMMSSF